jgi:hypothetical protein
MIDSELNLLTGLSLQGMAWIVKAPLFRKNQVMLAFG